MLYIITVHYKESKWIDIQRQYLEKYMKVPYKLWIASYDINRDKLLHADKLFQNIDPSHSVQLDYLAKQVLKIAHNNDHLLFMDSDSIFIREIISIEYFLKGKDIAAIQRLENNGDPQPHPCFCLVKAGLWKELGTSWNPGSKMWTGRNNVKRNDVGGELYYALKDNRISWNKIHRTNHHLYHKLWFGVYGNSIYHHGAGSRPFLSVEDFNEIPIFFRICRRMGICSINGENSLSKIMTSKFNQSLCIRQKKLISLGGF